MPKNLFISWSGPASHRVAILLHTWLPRFVQSIEPFLSSKNIRKGARWFAEVSAELSNVNFGIICMTPDNLNAPWLLFEAGALSKSLGQSRVTPLMINVSNSDLQGPLAEFNNTALTKEDFKQLLESANAYLGAEGIGSELLDQIFEILWPFFEKELKEALVPIETDAGVPQVRSTSDMLDELLQLTRDISQQLQMDRAEIKESIDKPSDSDSSSDLDESIDKEKLIKIVGTTSHELRAPIVGIRANASFLRSRIDQLSGELVDIKLNDILTDCELLLLRVEDLNYALGYRATPSLREPVHVFRDVIIKTINQLKPLLAERGIQSSQIGYHPRDIGRVRILTDRAKLQQVVFNILLNAIKYGEDDPAEFRINILLDETPQHFIVRFQDWGIGINDGETEKIFDDGFRGLGAMKKTATGSGLGLSIARALMRDMGGDLVLGNKSKPTEFRLLLPKPAATGDTSLP